MIIAIPDFATSLEAEPSPIISAKDTVLGVAADIVLEKQNRYTCRPQSNIDGSGMYMHCTSVLDVSNEKEIADEAVLQFTALRGFSCKTNEKRDDIRRI